MCERLGNERIQATEDGVAAILDCVAVVTWGSPGFGDDNSQVPNR